jgi:hypothetical protein
MDAFVMVLYNTNLSLTVDAANRLHEYTNVTVHFDFAEKSVCCKKTALFRRHQHYMTLASDTNKSILVLEDDFDPLPEVKNVWSQIVDFAEHGDFDYLNLGGVGANQFQKSKELIHKHWMWHAQAVIYSRRNRIRDKVISNFTGHFDWELRKTDAFMTKPLILQRNTHHRNLELLNHDYG